MSDLELSLERASLGHDLGTLADAAELLRERVRAAAFSPVSRGLAAEALSRAYCSVQHAIRHLGRELSDAEEVAREAIEAEAIRVSVEAE